MATGVIDGKIKVTLDGAPEVEAVREPEAVKGARFWGVLRMALGWTFLWSFLDKAFALGSAPGGTRRPG